MARKTKKPVNIVDPLDAMAALCDIQSLMNHSGMSNTDLAVELGWTKLRVENFLFGVDTPSKEDFVQVASVLGYSLDF